MENYQKLEKIGEGQFAAVPAASDACCLLALASSPMPSTAIADPDSLFQAPMVWFTRPAISPTMAAS